PAYRMYYYSMVGHWSPMQMQMVTRSLLIYRLTGSGTILGLMALAGSIPMLLLSLYGGALADRLDKRKILIWGQLASAVLSLAVGLALSFGYLVSDNTGSWWILVASSAAQGTIFGLMMPSRASILPEIVGTEELMNAISLNNLGMNFFRIAAPAATGFIISAWDFASVYYIMTALYFFSTIFLFWIPRVPPRSSQGRSTLGEIVEGLRYIKKETTIMLILSFTLCCTILGMPFNMLLPMFTEDVLKVGEVGLGILMGVSGIGAIAVSLVLASMQNRKRGIVMLLMGLMLSLSLIGFSFINSWYPDLVLVIFIGMGQTGQMAIGSTLVQYHVDPAYRGRVMSFQMLGFGLSSLGTVFGGVLADVMGIQWSVGSLAIALAVITIVILSFGRRLRQMD
ncbi:MAG: MFS transporter, partial [Dehalococcoidales bacterium]|nr:MFS transporter [Dehalococcoidales bacterium]